MLSVGVRPEIRAQFPCTVQLRTGRQATLRLMTADDIGRVVAFARGLPENDLLFLRIDITNTAVVAEWVPNQEEGRSVTLIAEVEGEMAGYGRLVHSETAWQRHLGEIRILTGERFRGMGLGRVLITEVWDVARREGLRKVIARMTTDQTGAIATFQRLGFQPEALLRNFVIDRKNQTHDLIMMSYDVEGLTDRVD
jgi:RimJ/RimL family protein N-acetyltransferase